MDLLGDLFSRRPTAPRGGNPLLFIELYGSAPVELLFYEPDPMTYRNQYYYNTSLNRLFKKLRTSAIGCNTKVKYVWKDVTHESAR